MLKYPAVLTLVAFCVLVAFLWVKLEHTWIGAAWSWTVVAVLMSGLFIGLWFLLSLAWATVLPNP